MEAFIDQIDGKYASGPGDIRVVAAQGANKLWSSTIVAAAVSNQTIAGFLRENGDHLECPGRLKRTARTATLALSWAWLVASRARLFSPCGKTARLSPTRIQRRSAKGEIALTMNTLWNFAVVRTANFKRLKFVS